MRMRIRIQNSTFCSKIVEDVLKGKFFTLFSCSWIRIHIVIESGSTTLISTHTPDICGRARLDWSHLWRWWIPGTNCSQLFWSTQKNQCCGMEPELFVWSGTQGFGSVSETVLHSHNKYLKKINSWKIIFRKHFWKVPIPYDWKRHEKNV
jgi:hypothetical protein